MPFATNKRVLWCDIKYRHLKDTVGVYHPEDDGYCVVSSQHIACSYSWKVISGQKRVLPSSSVIYVNKGGVFQCTMTYKSRSICGHAISVLADVGELLILWVTLIFSFKWQIVN